MAVMSWTDVRYNASLMSKDNPTMGNRCIDDSEKMTFVFSSIRRVGGVVVWCRRSVSERSSEKKYSLVG